MKPNPAVFLAAILAAIVRAFARTIISLDQVWAFYRGDAQGAEKPGFAAADWRKLDVPHDWSIAGPFDRAAPATGSGAWLLEWRRHQVLFPDWTPNNTARHDENVEIYSNAADVELFLNEMRKAVATNNRKEVATDTVRTAGKPAKIALIPDRKSIGPTFDDVAHVGIQLPDENGTLVPTAADLLQFTVTGPAKILGLDSGDIMSIEPFPVFRKAQTAG